MDRKNLINRRQFINDTTRYSLGAFLSFGISEGDLTNFRPAAPTQPQLGRVLYNGMTAHQDPDIKSPEMNEFGYNQVVTLSQTVSIYDTLERQQIWFLLEDGTFIQSRAVQIVQDKKNKPIPVEQINSNGQLAQVTVPYTTAWYNKKDGFNKPNQIFFYGSTHWVYGLGQAEDSGNKYYLVKEDRWGDRYYVDAWDMQMIPDDELQPISPEIPSEDKSIHINLKDQILVAYDRNEPVFLTGISSGLLSGNRDLTTPPGDFQANYKRPSRHMVHSDRVGINDNELYGVPWVTYFTDTGIAIHGTYWHNDFGLPRSHGCINLPIEAARWIYLWSQPSVSPLEKTHVSQYGTRILVY
jgi:hypothetical protein